MGRVKKEILIMADGDLEHSVTVKGRDEIGILARNLDEMRLALEENIRQEQEGKKANHDLIRSVSHDLRTPMTTLYGYLEILDQKKCPDGKQEEYIRRCIDKVEEIRALSDKMFEYALIYGKRAGGADRALSVGIAGRDGKQPGISDVKRVSGGRRISGAGRSEIPGKPDFFSEGVQ